MELFDFLTSTTGGKCLFTMLVSMLPIIELRGGLPFGVALGLSGGGAGEPDSRPLHHRLHTPGV